MKHVRLCFVFLTCTLLSHTRALALALQLENPSTMSQFFKKSAAPWFIYGLNRLQKTCSHRPRWLCQFTQGVEFESSSWKSMEGVVRCSANYVPLSPISFLERSAKVFGDRTSVVHGSLRYTWEETRTRCLKLASALAQLGISRGDVVATLAPNIPAMQELHFAVPMAGSVLCTLNTRHNSAMISLLLRHSEAKVLFVDYQLLDVAQEAINLFSTAEREPPILVVVSESDEPSLSTPYQYETLLETGHQDFGIRWPKTEWDPISINYTSGTTSRPKGVVYSHRGAYLNTISTLFLHEMKSMPVYLWTVPMFHCNGWCLVWGLAALGGTNICLRRVSPKDIFDSISLHKVTHMGGAPTVLTMLVNSWPSDQRSFPHKVDIMTGGAAPPPEIIFKTEALGFRVLHVYGLTEVYGPGTSCLWRSEWDSLPPAERSKLKARQGVQHFGLEEVDVRDSVTMKNVPADGKTMGEIMFRGNTVMSGYFKDLEATEEALRGGWFRSGDLAVKHPDNYIEVKDRLKDIIISGGENISTIEVETVLFRHPAVLEAAVVARPDNHWGQTPCAFVRLKEGYKADAEDLIIFCRDQLSHYMAPRTIIFGDLPKTSTGKVQKFTLREKAKALGSLF